MLKKTHNLSRCSKCHPSALKQLCFKQYGSYCLCNSNVTAHINLTIVKGHFSKVCLGLILLQYSFKHWYTHSDETSLYQCLGNTVMCYPQKPVTRVHSFPVITIFSYVELLFYTSSVSTVFCLLYFFSEKDPFYCSFFTNLKISDEAGTRTSGYLRWNILYTIYRISFSHKYDVKKSAVQVYILPLFITVN
jgi:hypothetical protein